MTKTLSRHPLSSAYGDMDPDDFIAFQDSIGSEGVQEPARTYEGKILDGWQRYSTAMGLGMDCPLEPFDGTLDEAKAFVKTKHLRRNMSASQRALAEAEVSAYGAQPVDKSTTAPGADSPMKRVQNLAESAGVSERTMGQAVLVARRGAPEVKQAVMDGAVSLKKAEKIARLPKKKQAKALAAPPAAPAWRPVGVAPLPRPQVGISKQEADELREAIAVLTEENERLNDRMAVMAAEGASDEEKLAYTATLEDLRSTVKTQAAELDAVKTQRAHYMEERNELMKQCAMYRNQLAKHVAKAA